MSAFSVRRMQEDEVQLAIDWAQKEGWNPGLSDAHCFYKADPNGFFVGLLDDQPIAVGAAVTYDAHFAFCGLYIVKSEFRQHGYGLELTHERLKYVGNRITGLDGVLNKIDKYKRLGYVEAHKNIRFSFPLRAFISSSKTTNLKAVPFSELERFDRIYFPAPRSPFLQAWIHQPQSHTSGYLENHKLRGYGVIRKCYNGYKIGPLFADSPAIAEILFEDLCSKVSEGPIYIDIPATNLNAEFLIKQYNMSPQFEVIRMYRNGTPHFDLQGVYGITTYEIG